ncbi:hypothetical protein MB02_08600 [Croceicoccus estronivorus]|uniref:hypothetical protein n=1 Tax=Croceicoccus estronivorus TaxID=1172626 RepID=UPI00082AB623|nr:hypothetical protein [Croceicoccus estronivorus]OCC23873.1 hypothetical protein MB02_08600 [Croceicoccus estronivorus]
MVQKTQKTAGKRAKAPISAHPLFAVLVATWFAALLGLGTLVLPARALESLVGATGIASIVHAAAPPLGTTARIAITLAATLAGALIGLLIARRIASSQAEDAGYTPASHASDSMAATTRQPLYAREELGSESFDSYAEDERHQRPAEDTIETLSDEQATPVETADTTDADCPTLPVPVDGAVQELASAMPDDASPIAPPSPEPDHFTAEAAPGEMHADAPRVSRRSSVASFTGSPVTERPLNRLGMVELVERLAHAIQERQTGSNPATASATLDETGGESGMGSARRPFAFREATSSPIHRWNDEEADLDREEDREETGYSSLLSLQKSLAPKPGHFQADSPQSPLAARDALRTPEQDIPRQSRTIDPAIDPEGAEDALRDALAKLQKISGAA